MMLGAKARYAVMAMVDLAMHSNDKPVKLAEIAMRQDIPQAYLEQIFSRLRQGGLVKSVKGPGGGYLLQHVAKELPISQIVTAADEEMIMTRCRGESHNGCMASKEQCLTHDLWEGLSAHIFEYFHTISLEDVCKRKIQKGNKI